MVNGLGVVLDRLGIHTLELDADALIAAARRKTGLEDFGGSTWREPLQHLLNSLNDEANLNLFGRMLTRSRILIHLSNRLQLREDEKRFPELTNAPIREPLFIAGMPRTGTSILHYLLAQDPDTLSLMQWKLEHLSPPPEAEAASDDPRIIATRRKVDIFYRMLPAFRAIHEMGAELPNECVVPKAHAFTTITYAIGFYVPSYQKWLFDQDQRDAYRYHARVLRQLQFNAPGRGWVLKTPGHLLALDALFETYPDATVVVTHRDPLEVVASLASLTTHLRKLNSEAIDPLQIGEETAAFWETALRRSEEFRAAHPELADRFIDVNFDAICRDPVQVAQEIYQRRGNLLDAATETRMRTFLRDHPRDAHGTHDYTLEAFGLDAKREAERFAWYRECHGFGAAA